MCGRFTLSLDPGELQEELALGQMPADLHPRYNIAPTQPVAVVKDGGSRDVTLYQWGLVPSWAKDPSIGSRMINARSETLQEKPSFRNAFSRRRCLILSDGFYEWENKGGKKTPYFIHFENGKPFAFAGLWEFWRSPEGASLNSCTIITCQANELVSRLHERMPVIIPMDRQAAWLDLKSQLTDLQAMLIPYASAEMDLYPVLPMVNNPANDHPDCMKKAL
jgi:putative SOS response-associated peptidase YedK